MMAQAGRVASLAFLSLALSSVAQAASSRLVEVAAFDHQATGVAVTSDGRVFVNFPRWTDDTPISVAEVSGGKLTPYPNAEWNAWRNARAGELSLGDHFICVQAIEADHKGNLWVLDPAAPGAEKALPGGPKLTRIDLTTNTVVQVIHFGEDVAPVGSYLNDVRFSPDGARAYISDSGLPGAIVAVDTATGQAKRFLDGHPSTQVDKSVTITVDGRPLRRPDGRQPSFAADGIALSQDGQTLYWQALTGHTLYSIATSVLDPAKAADAAPSAVKTVATTTVADGLRISHEGKLFITSPQDNSVKLFEGRRLETMVQDTRLRWPDTMAEGPDEWLYVTASHIQDMSWFKPDAPTSLSTQLFKFKPGQ